MRRASLLVCVALLSSCGTTSTAPKPITPRRTPAFTQAVVSSNWSGYVARRATGGAFDAVGGRWRTPRIACRPGAGTSAAFWVGIGGWGVKSPSLQQLGASADCSPAGVSSYRLWTEIVPSPPRFIPLRLAPGDVVDASTTVAGANVSFVLRNITRGTRYATTVKTAHKLDRSTAEWVAEAPSLCRTISSCEVVALSNFGTVQFTKVTATGGGVTGPLGVPTWRVTPVALLTSSSSPRYVAASNPYGAAPGPVTPGGRSFTVSFRRSFPGVVPPHPLAGAPLPSWVH